MTANGWNALDVKIFSEKFIILSIKKLKIPQRCQASPSQKQNRQQGAEEG